MLVNPGDSRLWYLKYRFNRKEPHIALDAYPQVSLSEARQLRDGIRKLMAQNINPIQQRFIQRFSDSYNIRNNGFIRAAAFGKGITVQ
ncbi:hypothetical protein GCM10009414_27710 [Tatumella terrea]